jgi:ABC-type transport system involved in multi-copper enzyme maturation permease subunit
VLLVGFAATVLTLLSVGAVCLFCSVLANTVFSATVGAYALAALMTFGCLCQGAGYAFSPISFVVELDNRTAAVAREDPPAPGPLLASRPDAPGVALTMLAHYATVHGLITLFGIAWAVAYLRGFGEVPYAPLVEAHPSPSAADERLPVPPPPHLPADDYVPPWLLPASPPVGDDALLWKEAFQGSGPDRPSLGRELLLPVALAVIAAATVWAGVAMEPSADWRAVVREVVNPIVKFGGAGLLTFVCIGVGFRAAGCVSRERDRRTLDALLVLPLTRGEVLRAKWKGCVLRLRLLACWLLVAWGFGLLTGALHPLALVLVVLAAAVHVAFVTTLGVWVSLVCRNTLWSYFTMALLLVVYFAGGWLAYAYAGAPSVADMDPATGFVVIGLNPWWSWSALAVPLLGSPTPARAEEHFAFALAALGVVWFALAAAGLWALASRRFEAEEARPA